MKLFLTLVFGSVGFLANQTLVIATPIPLTSTATIAQIVQFAPPPVPSDPPPGGRIRGGARRDPLCQAIDIKLTALAPFNEEQSKSIENVWGLTTEAHPTLWFYVPYTNNFGYPTEFVLQDQQRNPIYQKAIALPNRPGVIGISLPADAPPLELNKRYRWFLNVNCDQEKQSSPIYVEGVIQRVKLNQGITKELKAATLLQQAAIYAQNGIWHEALTTLAQLRQKNPHDRALQSTWKDLLSNIGLADIAAEPITTENP